MNSFHKVDDFRSYSFAALLCASTVFIITEYQTL